jgi:hypothetical protein
LNQSKITSIHTRKKKQIRNTNIYRLVVTITLASQKKTSVWHSAV